MTPIPASTGGAVILLVDDELMIQKIVRRALEPDGYELLIASTGAEALQLCEARKDRIHLAILDVIMPGMSGFVLARHLRDRWPRVRVIFMSGYSPEQAAQETDAQENAGKFLLKPFHLSQLREMVRIEIGAALYGKANGG